MLRLDFLGSVDLQDETGESFEGVLRRPKRLALLAYLALGQPRGYHRKDKLVAMFWPESEHRRARQALRQALYVLRRELGERVLLARGDEEIALNLHGVTVDALTLEQAVLRGDDEHVLELFKGDLLDGVFLSDALDFERWLENERRRLREAAYSAASRLISKAESNGNVPLAVFWARRAVTLSSDHEQGARQLITALDRAGDRAAALHEYELLARQLQEDHGVEPSPETRQLADAVRGRSGTPSGTSLSGDRSVTPASAFDTSEAPVSQPSLTKPVDDRRTRLTAGAAIVAVLVAGLWFSSARITTGGNRDGLVQNRIVVSAFGNQTGDTAFNQLGLITTAWITEGLLRTDLLEVIPTQTTLQAWQFVRREMAAGRVRDPVLALANETLAAVVISGSYYRTGDSLTFQAQITDARRGHVISPPLHASGLPDQPLQAIESLRQRIMGAVTAALELPRIDLELAEITTHAPTFEAYEAFVEGIEIFVRTDWQRATEVFFRSNALDSGFVLPLLWAGMALANDWQLERADSVAEIVALARDRLSRFESHHLDFLRATIRWDWEAGQRASKELSRIAPQSGYTYAVGVYNSHLNRPREGINWLQKLDPERGAMRDWHSYWVWLTAMHHVLEEYSEELRAARRARKQFPNLRATRWPEIRARAARGELERVTQLLEEILTLPPGPGGSYLRLALDASRESRAHGHADHARIIAQQAIGAYRTLPGSAEPTFGSSYELALLLFDENQLHEARRTFNAMAEQNPLVRQNPRSIEYRGHLAMAAARSGDRALARQISEELRDLGWPFLNGMNTLWRARIAATTGEQEVALRLLQNAIREGIILGAWLHADPAFEGMRDDPGFREILRPKG